MKKTGTVMSMNSAISRRSALQGSGALVGGALLSAGTASSAYAGTARQASLSVGLPDNIETLDPHQFRSIVTGSVLACSVETLLTRDPETMEIRPLLATSYRNVDPHTWEFKLRQGVRFQNGEPFNAESVKFSIERIINSPLNTLGKTVWPPSFGQAVQIVDPYTVRIVTKLPDPLVPNRLAAESLNMAPPKALAEFKDKYVSGSVIGTGPYKFVEYVVGRHVVFEADPSYWGKKPATSKIVWNIITDPATRVAALQRGTTDVIVNLPIPMITTVEQAPDLTVYSVLGSIVNGMLLNANQTPALKDPRVRQALNYAVDREAILKNLYMGRGEIANGVVAKQVQYAIDPGSYGYHPKKAKTLLAAAGFGGGLDLTIWQSTNRYEFGVEAAQAIVEYFQDVGVRTNLQLLDWGQFNAKAGRSQFKDGLFYGFVNGIWDPEYILQRFLPSYPTFRYFNAQGKFAEDLRHYGEIFPGPERAQLAAMCERGIHDEAAWVFLWQLNENFGLKKSVQGFKMRPDHMILVRDAFVQT
jgi:peptide/nickel transport system substrate-binding protein